MDGGRCLGITANVSPKYVGAPAHLWASHCWSLFLLLQATLSMVVWSRRPQWPGGSLTVHLHRASPLECCCPWQTHLWTATDGSGPQQHAGWGHNNHHSDSQLYISPTPPPADTAEPSGDIIASINLQLTGSMAQLQQASHHCPKPLYPGTTCQGNSNHLQLWGLCQQLKNQKIPSSQGVDSHLSCPNSDLHINNLDHDADISTGVHSSWYPQPCPHHSLNTSADPAKTPQMTSFPLSHGLWPQLRVDLPVCWMSSSSCRRKWTWP